MRLVRFALSDGGSGIGVWNDEKVYPLADAATRFPGGMKELLCRFEEVREELTGLTGRVEPIAPERLLAPVDAPEKIVCVGLNYRAHALETGKEPPSEPVIFAKLPSALIGPGDAIELPRVSNQVDFEAELVVVIGKTTRFVDEADAMEHVFGFCCGHDVSSRDWQYHHSGGQWLLGKSFDTFAPLGPFLVEKGAVPNPQNLRIQMHINGQTMQDSNTSDLIFSIPYLVSYLSNLFTLKPGDLIFTGTPSGVGVARNPQRFLQPGDQCTVEIEGLGELTNPVVGP